MAEVKLTRTERKYLAVFGPGERLGADVVAERLRRTPMVAGRMLRRMEARGLLVVGYVDGRVRWAPTSAGGAR